MYPPPADYHPLAVGFGDLITGTELHRVELCVDAVPYPEGVGPAPESPRSPCSGKFPASIAGFTPLLLAGRGRTQVGYAGTLVARVRGVVVWIILACLLILVAWALLLHVLKLG